MPAACVIVDRQISSLDQYKQYMADAPASIKRLGTTEYFNMVLVEGVAAPV